MKLKKWEIWFDYYTYLNVKNLNLTRVARNLIKCGFSYCTMHSNGWTFLNQNGDLLEGLTKINMTQLGNNAEIKLELNDNKILDDSSFAAEA